MANNYTDILALVNAGNEMGLSNTIKRDYGIPLDYTSVQESYEAALSYAQTSTKAYIGQPISVGDTLYIVTGLEGDAALKAVGTKPTGDNKSITVDENGVVSMFGFKAATNAMLPQKKVTVVDGETVEKIEWITIADLAGSTDTNTKTIVKAADGSDITVTPAHDEDTDTYTYTLDVQFPAIPEYSVTKETGESTVTYKVTKDGTQVGDAIVVPNAYDDTVLAGRVTAIEDLKIAETYATKTALKSVSDVADAAQTAEEVADAIDAKVTELDLANTYEAKGAAATAESNAKAYTDEEITGLELAFTDNKIQLTNKSGEVVAEFDASVFVQDSFLDDVKYEEGKIKFTWTMGDGSTKTDEVDVADFVPVYTVAEGSGLTLTGNEFSVNTSVIATVEALEAVEDKADAAQTAINEYVEAHKDDYTNDTVNTKISEAVAGLKIEDYAKSADVYTKTDADAKFQTIIPANTYDAYGAASDALAEAEEYVDGKVSTININLDKKIETASITHTTTGVSEGVTKNGTALEIVVDAYTKEQVYTKGETDNKIDVKIASVTGGESAAAVKLALESYRDALNAEVWGESAKSWTTSVDTEGKTVVTYTPQYGTTSRIDTLEAGVNTNATNIAAINNVETGILAQAKSYADSLKTNIETDYKAADTALGGRIDNLNAIINGVDGESAGIIGSITALQNKDTAIDGQITALNTTVSGHTTTITEQGTKIAALEDKDTELAGLIKANTDKFASYSTTEQMNSAIAAKVAEAVGDVDLSGIADNKAAIEAIYKVTGEGEQAVASGVLAEEIARAKATEQKIADDLALLIENPTEALDSVKELIEHVKANGTAVEGIITRLDGHDTAIQANVDAIAALDIAVKAIVQPKASEEVTVAEDGTLGLGKVNVNKLYQAEGDTLVINGGDASVQA